ncbi:MAG: phenylacetate--CoA ligase family protein, partial [Pseudomonadota bacterium]
MSQNHNTYFNTVDWGQLQKDHPIGDEFVSFAKKSRDEIRAHQNRLFRKCVSRAWEIPFYHRLWGKAGLEQGDITGLDDLHKIPMF